ncbi:MAG: thioredoxin-dependent thiol peroxidase [Ignavibacteria bacterium]|nr:thioredoxin-dependent thiol peroxidase [Ignavibacteria bacterium]
MTKAGLREGDKAPDFELTGDDGKVYSLSDFAGKKIVLYFYPKDNTSGCTKEACDFRDSIKIFEKKNSVIIGISKDSLESHRKFKEKHNLPFRLLSDSGLEAINKYGVRKEKSMYGKKYSGIGRSTFIIDERGFIEEIYRGVKVSGHTEEILSKI